MMLSHPDSTVTLISWLSGEREQIQEQGIPKQSDMKPCDAGKCQDTVFDHYMLGQQRAEHWLSHTVAGCLIAALRSRLQARRQPTIPGMRTADKIRHWHGNATHAEERSDQINARGSALLLGLPGNSSSELVSYLPLFTIPLCGTWAEGSLNIETCKSRA